MKVTTSPYAAASREEPDFSAKNPFFTGCHDTPREHEFLHIHAGIEFGTVVHGSGILKINNQAHPVTVHDCYFLDPLFPHYHFRTDDTKFEIIWIHVPFDILSAALCFPGDMRIFRPLWAVRNGKSPVFGTTPQLSETLQQISSLERHKPENWDMHARSLIISAVIQIALHPVFQEYQIEQSSIVASALRFVNSRFLDSFSVKDVAAHCGVSVSGLSHQFSRAMSISLLQYRDQLRISHAITRIRSTDQKLHTIALDCGFQSISQFRDVFERITGNPPGALRKSGSEA